MPELIRWLEINASRDDVIPGATFVGAARGTQNSDWLIYDLIVLSVYVGRVRTHRRCNGVVIDIPATAFFFTANCAVIFAGFLDFDTAAVCDGGALT